LRGGTLGARSRRVAGAGEKISYKNFENLPSLTRSMLEAFFLKEF